jgi:hypothetical protein
MLQVLLVCAGVFLFVVAGMAWYFARRLLLWWIRRGRPVDDFDARFGADPGDRRLTAAHHLRSAVRAECEIPDFPVRPDDDLGLIYGIDSDTRFSIAGRTAKAMRQPGMEGADWLEFDDRKTIRQIAEFLAKREQ